jgi:hypothetical protein
MNCFKIGSDPMTRKKLSAAQTLLVAVALSLGMMPERGQAQSSAADTRLQVTVNSAQDGPIQADDKLTLREAIALTNGTLVKDALSPQERAQVHMGSESAIGFNLPADNTTIVLKEALPPLLASGVTIDGTSQPGYSEQPSTEGIKPMVAITPAPDVEIRQGLIVMADQVAIRGLSVYGFSQAHLGTAAALPADILITDRLPDQNAEGARKLPPQDVSIEHNWLGISPQGTVPPVRSAFGVSIFNGDGTLIRNNRIADHDGSGVITSLNASKTLINGNWIEHNGQAGMPDAIRLEGNIDGVEIIANDIRDNDGSAIYLFKPDGSILIKENHIIDNGRRLQRAAIVLMGSGHQVLENEISGQSGPGVTVTAYPKSHRNIIANNRFAHLEGLSIDLTTYEATAPEDYRVGDGPNGLRNSVQRRKDTGNAAINAPQFLAPDFPLEDGLVKLDGKADPGSEVVLYRVEAEDLTQYPNYATLTKPVMTVTADEHGHFSADVEGMAVGDRMSAIATHPQYGTSEPSAVVKIFARP